MIVFIEDRELLNKRIVNAGEECDFGPEENAAFVRNGVAVYVDPQDAPAEEVVDHG